MKKSYMYIMASKRNGTLYVGVTSDLISRDYKHKHDTYDGFSKKYQTHKLVYYEQHEDIEQAILREKQVKHWNRKWKIELIENVNPDWKDLSEDINE